MKSRVVLAMFISSTFATLLSVVLFYVVTHFVSEPYLNITGKLIHDTKETNKALLHLVSQGSVLGALGGSLFVMQVITHYIAFGTTSIVPGQKITNYWLYGFIVPLKGLTAGIIGITIVGGILMMVGGIELLADSHLFIIGSACIAGYSEQFLQKVVDVAERRLSDLEK